MDWLNRRIVIYIDGQRLGAHHIISAVGMDREGRKHILGLEAGATENAAAGSNRRDIESDAGCLEGDDSGRGKSVWNNSLAFWSAIMNRPHAACGRECGNVHLAGVTHRKPFPKKSPAIVTCGRWPRFSDARPRPKSRRRK